MTAEEQFAEIRTMLKTVAVTAGQHDNQIEALIKIGEVHDRRLKEVTEAIANLEKQWQAYPNTLPRQ